MKRFKGLVKRYILQWTLLFGGWFAVPGYAQPAAEMGLKECLQYALRHNSNIAISRYEEQVGEQQIIETRARALPQVNASGNFTDNYKRQVMALPGEIIGQPGKTVTATMGMLYSTAIGADASQTIFDKAVFDALKAARAGRSYYQLSTEQTEEEVIHQVATTYYQLLAAMEQEKTLKQTTEKLSQMVLSTRAQYDNGLARKIDYDRIRVNLTNARTQLAQQETRIVALANQLKTWMGMDIRAEVVPSGLAFQEIEAEASGSGTLPWTFDAEQRTEIRLMDVQRHLYELQRRATRAEYFPKLSAFANYSYNGLSNDFNDIFRKGGEDVWFGFGSFGLRLSMPLFDGFSRRARIATTTIQLHQLAERRSNLERTLYAGYENARNQISYSIVQIRAQKENVQLAREVHEASRQNYDLGLASLTDYLDAETSYMDAQNSYTQSLLSYKLAELEITRTAGNLKTLVQ